MNIVYLQDISAIPNMKEIWHIGSCNGRQTWPILTISTYFKVLPYSSPWVKVDPTLLQQMLTVVQSRFANRIRNLSVDVEIYISYVKVPSISLPDIKANIRETSILYISISTEPILISIQNNKSAYEIVVYI